MYSNSAVDRCLQMFLSQRKERESNPQGLSCKLGRFPTGACRQSVCPSIMCFSSSTRNRTWNFSLEARGDIRFTIEPCSLRQLIEPTKRKAWELNPHNFNVALFSKQARRTVSGYLPIEIQIVLFLVAANSYLDKEHSYEARKENSSNE